MAFWKRNREPLGTGNDKKNRNLYRIRKNPNDTHPYLQLVPNAAFRLLTGTKRFDHITPVLISLHWLLVKQIIDFKIYS